MSKTGKFAFDVSLTFIASVITALIGFIITIVLGKYLGPEDLGLYKLLYSIYSLTLLIATIGVPTSIIKFVAEYKEERTQLNRIISAGIITSIILGIIFSVVFFTFSWLFSEIFHSPQLTSMLKILSPVYPFAFLVALLIGLLNGLRKMKQYALATIINSILMIIVSLILIYYGWGVVGTVIGIISSSVGTLLYLVWVCRDYFEFTLNNYVETTKKLLSFGFQISIAGAINEITNQLDLLLVGFFLTAVEVGYYSVSVGLSNFFWLIPISIQIITYPATAEYWTKKNYSELNKMVDISMRFSAIMLLTIGLVISFYANFIITLLFSDNFIYSILPLEILLIGTVIRGILQSIGGSLASVGRPDLIFKISVLTMIINLTLNLILIPKVGIIGAAISTTISLIAGAFVSLFMISRILSIKIDIGWYIKIFFVVICSILIFKVGCYFINEFLIGGVIIVSYLILIVIFFINEEDKRIIKSLTSFIGR